MPNLLDENMDNKQPKEGVNIPPKLKNSLKEIFFIKVLKIQMILHGGSKFNVKYIMLID